MLEFLRRLLSGGAEAAKPAGVAGLAVIPDTRTDRRRVSDAYFETMAAMQAAISKQNYKEAGRMARENLGHLAEWVKESERDYGSFDIRSIPVLEQGGTVLALLGDDTSLARMQRIIASVSALAPWSSAGDEHQRDQHLFRAILDAVTAHPNCLQTEVKELVGENDGRRIAHLISYLEKAGRIVRVKAGRSHKIMLPNSPYVPPRLPKAKVSSHRTDRQPPDLRAIDASSLSYVPLPRAPLRWEEAQAGRERESVPEPQGHFEVHHAQWLITAIETIPLAERPDSAFRQLHPTNSGLFLIDDLGKANGFGEIEAAVLRYDRVGSLAARRGLTHGVYRLGVHPLGHGLIAMARDCVLHAYDDDLNAILETTLADAPEILAVKRRLGISDDELKNHVRCVALSQNATRYLFTAVDEAWCIDLKGRGLWGARLPFKEGWTRATPPGGAYRTSEEVDRALSLMQLSLPLTPEELKRRYRDLAKQWHPDLNPSDAQAHERMKALTAAAEVLTGIEASAIARYTGATFVRELERLEIPGELGLTVTVGMHASEIHAADWIYAASFAAKSQAVYLAGYSGRVHVVDQIGQGVRVYDIGAVPRRIVDTGDYLYLLTDTRLYVLRDDALHAVVDTFDGGELIVAQSGFGLLEKKRLRWFSEDGHYLGSIISKEPIRRLYSTEQGMVVETRQRRGVIHGVPGWWA